MNAKKPTFDGVRNTTCRQEHAVTGDELAVLAKDDHVVKLLQVHQLAQILQQRCHARPRVNLHPGV